MYVDDLDIPLGKMTDAARRVVDRALEESHRREHSVLTSEHLFYAFARVEWDLFAHAMQGAAVNPHHVLRAIDEVLRRTPSGRAPDVRVSPAAKLVCKLALQHASRAGHSGVEAGDLTIDLVYQR